MEREALFQRALPVDVLGEIVEIGGDQLLAPDSSMRRERRKQQQ
jgi:hypothetical protein